MRRENVLFSERWLNKLSLDIRSMIHIHRRPQKHPVRLKIAVRQVKVILPGLRSEKMEKEKSTRQNKFQSNVNKGTDGTELSLTLELV